MRVRALCLTMFLATVFPGTLSWPQTAEVVFQHNVAMKTRDGVTLKADIYRLAGEGKYPVLLQRTPYDKSNAGSFARQAALRGYLVVVQDVRGRYASDGEWYTFKHETDDGYDTVEWAAVLPNSDGRVGMFGGSYVGATQMLAAVGHPPHLAGICPVVTASNYHENWAYQGGALEQWFDQSWTSGLAQNTLSREVNLATDALIASPLLPLTAYPLFNLKLPSSPADLTRQLAPYYLDWLSHPLYDSYWQQWAIDERFSSIQVPALTIAAWYDIFHGGSLRNYEGMRDHAGNERARKQQRLLVTVGGHAGGGRKIGSVDFGPEAAKFDENRLTLEWYDYLFKGAQNEFVSDKHVQIFVMGDNQWRFEDDWPLARAKEARYFLHAESKANSLSGNGSLSTAVPGKEKADEYVYDPSDPAPTVGGPLCCDSEHLAPGPQDQRRVEERQDVLVYTTAPLDQDMEVTGPIKLDLYASSSAVDTDFTAKLVDVAPDGFAQNLTEGILRARFRESTTESKPIVPGKIYEYAIDLWATSNVFLKGHKVRLEVSSSNFPRFDRNLNTGRPASASADMIKATNTIYHDREHPSALLLPVTPSQ